MLTPEGDTETYDQLGRLTSIQLRSGRTRVLIYSDATTPANIAPKPNLLIQVIDNFGKSLHLRYDTSSRLIQLIDPASQSYIYSYDSLSNLTSVTYPDGLKRVYLYSEPAFDPNAGDANLNHLLTGISDEISAGNIVRYATFTYDGTGGRPISTQHANGANLYTLNYNYNWITDPLGTQRAYTFAKVNGVSLPTSVSQPAGAGCAAASSSTTYNANGNVSTRLDFKGTQICYDYDLTRNLETTRVEGLNSAADCPTKLAATFLTAPSRKISTQWHATRRIPVAMAEPNRLTKYSYDVAGNLINKTERATTDATGALGFDTTLTGTPRAWNYTYNSIGQVLTATDPLNNVTTYTYNSHGNFNDGYECT